MKKILVTGGAGFLGSHLCEWLTREGNRVWALDNLSTGRRENFFGERLVEADVCEYQFIDFDEIYHLACPASPVAYQRDPIGTTMISVLGSQRMLQVARRHSNPKILLASTSEVYGDPLEHPQTESYRGNVNPIGPRSCYDEGKRCAESLFMDYHRVHGTRIKIARIFNTYGPRMQADDGRVIPTFITQALRGEPLTVFGDGSQTRSFCYVDDMVEGLIRLMATGDDETGPMNLGYPSDMTILDMAEEIIRQTGSKGGIEFKPLPQDDPAVRLPDIMKARLALDGWHPNVLPDVGLSRTIDYFRAELEMVA